MEFPLNRREADNSYCAVFVVGILFRPSRVARIDRSFSRPQTGATDVACPASLELSRNQSGATGRFMAGARGPWRATGMKGFAFAKPMIAVANSVTRFVPGHVHFRDTCQPVAGEAEAAGGSQRSRGAEWKP